MFFETQISNFWTNSRQFKNCKQYLRTITFFVFQTIFQILKQVKQRIINFKKGEKWMNEQMKIVAVARVSKDTTCQTHAKYRAELALCTPHGLTRIWKSHKFQKCATLFKKFNVFLRKFITFIKSSWFFTKTFVHMKSSPIL